MKGKIWDCMVLKKPDLCTLLALHALSPACTPYASLISDFLEEHFFINKMVKFTKKIGRILGSDLFGKSTSATQA